MAIYSVDREFDDAVATERSVRSKAYADGEASRQFVVVNQREQSGRRKEWVGALKERITTTKKTKLEAQKQSEQRIIQTKMEQKERKKALKEVKKDIASLTEELNSKCHILEEEKKAAAQREEERASRVDRTAWNLPKIMDTFRISVRRVEGDQVQFIFTHVDRDDPERICYFLLKLLDGRQYHVTETHPEVPDKEEMVAQLNESNNFSRFVSTIRKRFQTLIEEEKKSS